MIKPMGLVFIVIVMALSMKDSGRRISSTERALKLGQTDLYMKEVMFQERNMDKGNSNGQMEVNIMVGYVTMTSRERESTFGLMEESMKGDMLQTKCLEQVLTHGLMGESM